MIFIKINSLGERFLTTLISKTLFQNQVQFFSDYSSVPNRRACTFINFERKKSTLHGLILVCTFIDFEKKFPPARLFHPARLLGLLCSNISQLLLLAILPCLGVVW